MPQRLTPLEVSLLALDTAHTPGHVGTVDVFDAGPEGMDYERLIALIRDRIAYVPRYRQRVRSVPARLAGPVWVDDEDFDLTFHVRRSAMPRPGTMDQLYEFAGRVLARRMDRSRPLWEIYLVEGLEQNRFALVAKTHLALVDGTDTVDLGQVLLDSRDPGTAEQPTRTTDENPWHPAPEPTPLELVVGALWESTQDPVVAIENVRGALTGALGVAVAVGEVAGGVVGALGELAGDALRGVRPLANSPLTGVVSEQRRVATVNVPLADLRAVRDEHDHTINDVVLAVITGGLRAWLLTRGESLSASSHLTALVPMSVTEDDGELTSLGSQVAPHVQRLPIGEPNALMRLHQVAFGTQAHKDTGRSIGARSLSDIAGFAPSTLHALGVRVSAEMVRKPHDVLITNVPGPQMPLYAAGARMTASFPMLPLSAGHLLTIGVTSYDGQVSFGLTADRDALRDLTVLSQCLLDALEELLDTTVRSRSDRQPTRKASAAAQRSAARKAAARSERVGRTSAQKRAAVKSLAVRAAELSRESGERASSAAPAKRPAAKTPGKKAADPAAATRAPAKAAQKAAATKVPARKSAAKKAPAKKAPAKKAPAKKAANTKATTEQSEK